jgi:hypothetical protein
MGFGGDVVPVRDGGIAAAGVGFLLIIGATGIHMAQWLGFRSGGIE